MACVSCVCPISIGFVICCSVSLDLAPRSHSSPPTPCAFSHGAQSSPSAVAHHSSELHAGPITGPADFCPKEARCAITTTHLEPNPCFDVTSIFGPNVYPGATPDLVQVLDRHMSSSTVIRLLVVTHFPRAWAGHSRPPPKVGDGTNESRRIRRSRRDCDLQAARLLDLLNLISDCLCVCVCVC